MSDHHLGRPVPPPVGSPVRKEESDNKVESGDGASGGGSLVSGLKTIDESGPQNDSLQSVDKQHLEEMKNWIQVSHTIVQ